MLNAAYLGVRRMKRSVVISKLRDEQSVIISSVNDTVLAIDPARPVARKCVFQWLRFADAFKRRALNVRNQLVDPLQHFFVGLLPIEVIVPCVL